jgi:diguanylate cyclase (GGDEF)-like protein
MNELSKFAKDFISLSENAMFYYNCETNEFRLFWINYDRMVDIANMDFDEWEDDALSENKIAEEDISVFKIFCNSIKSCIAKGTYSFHSSLISPDDAMVSCKISFIPKRYEDAQYILGEWRIISDFTGDTIAHYTEGRYADPLTGLFNQKSIVDYAKKRLENTSFGQSALILLNLDNFSRINSIYGHKFGDKVLQSVADIIRGVIGANGVEGRMAGDEFMIVLNDAGDELIIRNYLRAIKTSIRTLFPETLGDDRITCSMGISRSRLNSNIYDELYKIAERVLYIAKQKGKNRYIIYKPEMHGQILSDSFDSDYNTGIEKVYSDVDLYKTAKHLANLVIDNTSQLTSLLEQLSRTLMVDRITVFWGTNYNVLAASNPDSNDMAAYPKIMNNRKYLNQFSDDMFLIGNINLIKGNLPEIYSFLQDLGIASTMQHLLRDKNGNICGLIITDECQATRAFPQIAVQTFSFVCKVINSILIKSEKMD